MKESDGVEPLAPILLALLLAIDPFPHLFGSFKKIGA
jgi:hypothetical protein